MGFRCGIVGLPNVGKSTLFNALTAAKIAAENYPFCTIEPNVGIVPVNDPRLDKIAEIVKPKQILPTTMEFVDIAGLVKGASKGEGLGNKFLANIRETQAIAHVVRCFENENITHVAGKIDPIADIEVIHTELALADLDSVDKAMQKLARFAKSGDKTAVFEYTLLEKVKAHLDTGQPARSLTMDDKEQEVLQRLHLLTTKPTLYIANVDEAGLKGSPYAKAVEEYAAKEGAACVIICAEIEAELQSLTKEERVEYLKDLGLAETGLDRVIRAGHKLLGLQSYFTAGVKEVRAWTIPLGAKAPQAAGVIHTDFERGFIRAEICSYDDFIQFGGEQGAKEAGKMRSEGKEYVVQDGDIIHFRFNV